MFGLADSRVLFCQRTFAAFREIDAEDIEVAIAGNNHDLRCVATHGNHAAERAIVPVATRTLVWLWQFEPGKITGRFPHFADSFRKITPYPGSDSTANVLRGPPDHT